MQKTPMYGLKDADASKNAPKYIFVARLAPKVKNIAYGISAAGEQVQRKIGEELSAVLGTRKSEWHCWRPMRGWPHGPLYVPSLRDGKINYPSTLNVPILRDFFWGFILLSRLMRENNCVVVFYNAYLADMLVVWLLRLLPKRRSVCVIVQDVRVDGSSFTWRARMHDRIAMRFLRHVDLTVAVTQAILQDFKIPEERGFVFSGAITETGEELLNSKDEISPIALYAGAIEPHNGVLALASQWINQSISLPLHILGRGSDSAALERLVKRHSNVIFHGFQNSAEVLKWQRRAALNICLRFDSGLNQEYFFPSKFYNAICAPGAVIVNSFKGIPEAISSYLLYVDDDMKNLGALVDDFVDKGVEVNRAKGLERRSVARKIFQWRSCIEKIVARMSYAK